MFAAQGHDARQEGCSWPLAPSPRAHPRDTRGEGKLGFCLASLQTAGAGFPSAGPQFLRDRRELVGGSAGRRRAGDRQWQPPMSAPSNAAPQRQAAADVCAESGTRSPPLPRGPPWLSSSLKQSITCLWGVIQLHVCVCVYIYI